MEKELQEQSRKEHKKTAESFSPRVRTVPKTVIERSREKEHRTDCSPPFSLKINLIVIPFCFYCIIIIISLLKLAQPLLAEKVMTVWDP